LNNCANLTSPLATSSIVAAIAFAVIALTSAVPRAN
jgi:hypothetical protein